MLTQEHLKSVLSYDQHTGIFTRIKSVRSTLVGKKAGCIKQTGYFCIKINYKPYQAHRLAFLYMTGKMPKLVDHINQIKDDNRWSNLREATRPQNAFNSKTSNANTSGYRGVYWHKENKKWTAAISINGRLRHLGCFQSKESAHKEYVKHSIRERGEFSANLIVTN